MKQWDTVKFILFASLFLCLTGVGLYAYQLHDLGKLESDIPRSLKMLENIGMLSAEVEERRFELDRDQRASQGLLVNDYVERQAHDSGISYQALTFETEKAMEYPREGYVDKAYQLTGRRNAKFSRADIAEFIFKLQTGTNRLKVTELHLSKPENKQERWSMGLKLTERKPLQAKK
jgi:hypothetical protein